MTLACEYRGYIAVNTIHPVTYFVNGNISALIVFFNLLDPVINHSVYGGIDPMFFAE